MVAPHFAEESRPTGLTAQFRSGFFDYFSPELADCDQLLDEGRQSCASALAWYLAISARLLRSIG